MYIGNICDVPDIMKILRIVNIILTIIRIAIPIILIVSVMLDYMHAIKDNDELAKTSKLAVKKLAAALLVFLIPTFVKTIANVIGTTEYTHCLGTITKEQIVAAYNEVENDLVEKAEQSLDINDYNNAKIYLNNITDDEARKDYLARLEVVKAQIDEANKKKQEESQGGYPSQTYGSCEFVQKRAGNMTYGLCVPKNYSNQSIPMIVWLHGAGEVGGGFGTLKGSGLLKVVEKWSSTGLEDIPAIIVAPLNMTGSWGDRTNINGVKAVMDDVMSSYNINKNNVSLIGHSLGGSGVYLIGAAHQSYFTCIVMLSGYVDRPSDATINYFKNIPMKGYSESGSALTHTTNFFKSIGKESEVRKLNCSHGEVPKVALTIDDNGDKRSDLIYWMLSNGKGSNYGTVADNGTQGTPVVDSGGNTACNKNGKYTQCSPSRGVFGSFPYYDSEPNSTSNRNSLEMDPVWKKNNLTSISKTCSNGLKMYWTVHVKAKSTFQKAQDKICQITTTGIDGIIYDKEDIRFNGTTVIRFISNSKSISNHAYGLAIDINADGKYTIDGKTYTPYGRDINQYNNFVKALGNENDTRNINYVLWVKIFKPLGFTWGRNWSASSYDGMHFEIDWKNAK